MGATEKFWSPHSIKSGRDQPGNPKAENELPSSHIKMSPEKAKKILHDGTIRGHPITPAQRGLFGSIAGRKK